jgi:hypothetical protein
MPSTLTPGEEAQLMQTIEMFEVITQSQPLDYQSLEILKEAYFKLGRQKDVVNTAKRIAQAYVHMGQLSSAILEYESVLQLFPDDPDVKKALAEIEDRANSLSVTPAVAESDLAEKLRTESPRSASPGTRFLAPKDQDDGRKGMHKALVEGKHLNETDFDAMWPEINPLATPTKVLPPFIQTVSERGLLSIDKMLKILCERSRLCFIPLEKYDVDVMVVRTIPAEICRRWCVLPFDRLSKSLLVATCNPFNKLAVAEIERITQNRLLWYLASPLEITLVLNKAFR